MGFLRRELIGGLSVILASVALFENKFTFTKPVLALLVFGGVWTATVIGHELRIASWLPRRAPKVEILETTEYWRPAAGSRDGNDLQVVYARVRNARRRGGDKATIKDAVTSMEAFDLSGKRIMQCRGNWHDLAQGQPSAYFNPLGSVTLRPTGEEYGLEIAGKFSWGDTAWLAGEGDPPSLVPGNYVIRASVSDGVSKPWVFKWDLQNPGPNANMTAVEIT